MARPTTWHQKIRAPQSALKFYEALVQASQEGAFEECHLFSGALSREGNPVIAPRGLKTTDLLTKVAGSYLGLVLTGRRNCQSAGCMKPFHYEPVGVISPRGPEMDETIQERPTPEHLMDLFQYVLDSKDLPTPQAPSVFREAIHTDDLTEGDFEYALTLVPPSWIKVENAG